jgi:predicted RNA-binding protein
MSLNEVGIYSSLKLGRDNVPESDWPCLLYGGPKQFGINDSLTVTGNVGIGTTTLENPEGWSRILDLLGVTDAKLSVRTAKIDGRVSVHEKGCWGSPAGAMILGTKTNHALSFGTNATTKMTILGNGNVGIGTITPGAKLEVSGNLTVTGNIGIATTAAPTERLEVNGNVKATSFLGDGSNLTGVVKNLDLAVKKAGDTMTGSLTIQNNLTVTGNISIATTAAPTERLEVNGNVKATSFLGDGSNLTGVVKNLDLAVKKAGDTMSGALTIQDNLTVNGNFHINQGTQSSFGSHLYLSKIDGSPGRGQWHINIAPNNALNFVETGIADYRLTITPGGNIGIGTSSPKYKLDVRGNDGWIGSGDSSQSQGGWRLGRWPDYESNTWVYLSRADGTKYQDLAVGALWAGGNLRFGSSDDLAEMTPVKTEDDLDPGDVVVIENPPDNRVLLAKSNKPDDSKVAGVISDPNTAGLIIGGSHPTDVNRDDLKPLALAGRVLTKVTTENGFINAGDFLTTSSTPGCAMKANIPSYTLGKALQCFNGNGNGESMGKIWVLVNLGWVGGVTKE